jgi:DNA-directed RNA polymerase II subunit RPB2
MTIGQFVETVMAKACVVYGAFGDCTAFVNLGNKHTTFGDMLQKENYSSTGTQLLYNGTTGEQIESDIFIGPTYYMRLKHMVKDKINFRARGPNTNLTRQPVQGRANDGGLRIGEMERDGIIAHGATRFLQESMLVRGDNYYLAICNKTGMTAIYNPDSDVFMSPMADGPIQFNDALTDTPKLVNITRFGRSFSVVQIPYSLKLLVQELQTMNCAMRIITEDNISQIESMSFSNNYKILSGQKGVNADSDVISSTNVLEGGDNNDQLKLIISNESAINTGNDDDEGENDVTMEEIIIEGGGQNAIQIVQSSSPPSLSNTNETNEKVNVSLNIPTSEEMTGGDIGNEWTKLVEPESGKEYYYNEKTKDTMWFTPQPSKDYELRPPFGWYTIKNDAGYYFHNPQKNLIKNIEDVTFADANPPLNQENDEDKRENEEKQEPIPSILRIEKVGGNDGDNNENEHGNGNNSGDGNKKIIF